MFWPQNSGNEAKQFDLDIASDKEKRFYVFQKFIDQNIFC